MSDDKPPPNQGRWFFYENMLKVARYFGYLKNFPYLCNT